MCVAFVYGLGSVPADVLAAEAPGQSSHNDGYGDFLWPEKIVQRGCAAFPAQDRESAGQARNSPRHGHYCIAHFNEREAWQATTSGVSAEIEYAVHAARDSKTLTTRLDETEPATKKTVFRLNSEPVRQARFESVDAVRLWVRGNASSAGLRIQLVDSEGEVFTHRRPVRLNFDRWALEDISFAPEYVLSHGKDANDKPDPPLTLHAILLVGSAEAMVGEVTFDRLSVVGTPWAGDSSLAITGSAATAVDESVTGSPIGLSFAERLPAPPLVTGSSVVQRLSAQNRHQTPVEVKIRTTVRRVLGSPEYRDHLRTLDPGKRHEISLPMHFSDPGWYRIEACAETTIGPDSCVQDEYFVWNPVGNLVEDNPETFPGAMMSADLFLERLDDDLAIMKDAGVKVLRFPFRWKDIQMAPKEFAWRNYDLIFEACRRANIIPQPMVIQTPNWARRTAYRDSANRTPGKAFSPPADTATFRSFMAMAAGRYAEFDPYWEIWNEPYSRGHWAGGTDQDYIDLLRAGFQGVRSVDDTAPVLSAGAWAVDGPQARFSRNLLANGRSFFDIFALHSHGGVHRLYTDLDDLEAIWPTGTPKSPVWLNETGVTVDPHRADGELFRAAETVKKMVLARARGIENYGWFIFRHLPNSYRDPYHNYSVMNEDGNPRPALLAYNNAIRWLRNTQVSRIDEGRSDHSAYEFLGDGRRVLILWGRDPEIVVDFTQFPAWLDDRYKAYDMFGGPLITKADDTGLAIELTGNPVFLVTEEKAQTQPPT
jgi:hypothetical protein